MNQENIMFSKKTMINHTSWLIYIKIIISFGYEDYYKYYDIDVNKILLLKKSDMEYFVRHNDVNKNKIVPQQLEMNNFSFGSL